MTYHEKSKIYKKNPDGGFYDGFAGRPIRYLSKRKKSNTWKVYKKWKFKGKEYQCRVK